MKAELDSTLRESAFASTSKWSTKWGGHVINGEENPQDDIEWSSTEGTSKSAVDCRWYIDWKFGVRQLGSTYAHKGTVSSLWGRFMAETNHSAIGWPIRDCWFCGVSALYIFDHRFKNLREMAATRGSTFLAGWRVRWKSGQLSAFFATLRNNDIFPLFCTTYICLSNI